MYIILKIKEGIPVNFWFIDASGYFFVDVAGAMKSVSVKEVSG